MYVKLVVFLSMLILFSGCLNYVYDAQYSDNQKRLVFEPCENISNTSSYDNCVKENVRNLNLDFPRTADVPYADCVCPKLKELKSRDECYLLNSISKDFRQNRYENINYCNKIEKEYEYQWCTAFVELDPSKCSFLSKDKATISLVGFHFAHNDYANCKSQIWFQEIKDKNS